MAMATSGMRSLVVLLLVGLVVVQATTETGDKVHEVGTKASDHAAAAADAAADAGNTAGEHASSWTGWAKEKINNVVDSATK